MKKVLSYFLALAIILSAFVYLPNIGTSVMATETVEDLLIHDGTSTSDSVNVYNNGSNGDKTSRTFAASTTAASANNLTMYFTEGIDLSSYNTIELNLNLASEPAVWDTWKDYMKFVITIGGTKDRSDANYYHDGLNYTWPVPASLEQGDNQISLDLEYIRDLGVDLSNVTRLALVTYRPSMVHWRMDAMTPEGGTSGSPNKSAYYNMHSCGLVSGDVSAITQNMTVSLTDIYAKNIDYGYSDTNNKKLSSGGYGWIPKTFIYGSNTVNFPLTGRGSVLGTTAYDVFSADADVSSYKYLEFDFYISDLEQLKNEIATNNSNLYQRIILTFNTKGRVSNYNGTYQNYATANLSTTKLSDEYTYQEIYLDDTIAAGDEYVTESGWTHVVIPVSKINSAVAAKMGSMSIGISSYDYVTSGLAQNYSFGFKNVRATNGAVSITESYVDEKGNTIADSVVTGKVLSTTTSENIFTSSVSEIEGYQYSGYRVNGGDIIKSSDISISYNETGSIKIEYVYRKVVEDYLIHDGRNYKDFDDVVIYPGANSQRTFDFDGAMSTNHLIYRFNNGIDLSDYNELKFDLTLVSTPESYDMWKDNLKFVITVGGTLAGTAGGGPFHDGTNYTWPVPASLEEGSNEITLSLQYLKDLGVDLSNVTRFGVGSFTNNFYWRTDGVTLEGNYTQAPYNKSAYYTVQFGATSSSFPSITQDMTIALRDIYAVYTETELINEENEITLSNGGYGYIAKGATRLGANGSGSDAIAYDVFDKAVDASSMEYIEFDFFISDLEAFRAETKSGNSGNAYNLIVVKINSQGRMTNTGGDPKVNITGFHVALDGYTMCDLVYLDNQNTVGDEYISNSGWTHIRIPISSLSATAKKALANFKSLAIGFSPVGQATDALTQNYSFGFKNLKVTNGIPGDVNNDTEVDIRDLVRFKRHLAGADVEFKVGNSTLGIDYSLTQSMAELRKFLLGKTTLTR